MNDMKAINIIFIVIFIIFTALQYNDPDPYIWMPIYLFAAFLCYKATTHQYPRGLYIAALAVYLSYAAFLLFDKTGVINWAEAHHAENIVQTMKAEKPWIEETREFGGLLIVMAVLLANMAWLSKKHAAHQYNVE